MTLNIDVKRKKSKVSDDSNLKVSMTLVEINKFAEFIREEEREACAKMVEPLDESLADEIRARGQK